MKLGLSLCGGGSKGSYELGVWDYIREIDMKFDVVTGTSIGSLNAAMYVQDKYDVAETLWNNVKINNVLENGFDIDEMNLSKIVKNDEFKTFIKEYVKDSKKTINPFKELLEEYINYDKIVGSGILFGVCISTFPTMKKEEILINELSEKDMRTYILASCSMFPFFPVVKINRKQYVDGGYSDNLPIEFAFKLGASRVVAVDLNHKITHPEYLNNAFVDYIYPKYDLGSFLYFNKEVTKKNRMLGYNDAAKHFGKYEGFKFTFNKDRNLFNTAKIATLQILNDSIEFNNNSTRSYVKKNGYKDVFSYLNKHIYGKINDYDYFLKCVEELCFIFEKDPTKVYDIKDLLTSIKEEAMNIDVSEIVNEYVHLKSIFKRRDYMLSCDKKIFVGYLFQNMISHEFRMFLLQANIELYLSLVVISALGVSNEI